MYRFQYNLSEVYSEWVWNDVVWYVVISTMSLPENLKRSRGSEHVGIHYIWHFIHEAFIRRDAQTKRRWHTESAAQDRGSVVLSSNSISVVRVQKQSLFTGLIASNPISAGRLVNTIKSLTPRDFQCKGLTKHVTDSCLRWNVLMSSSSAQLSHRRRWSPRLASVTLNEPPPWFHLRRVNWIWMEVGRSFQLYFSCTVDFDMEL